MGRRWLGIGNIASKHWFCGLEPGGTERADWPRIWADRFGGAEVIDGRMEAGDPDHARGFSPTSKGQPTWIPLIRTLLAFKGEPADDASCLAYQRERFAAGDGDEAVLELSAYAAANLGVDSPREKYMPERIARIAELLAAARAGVSGLLRHDAKGRLRAHRRRPVRRRWIPRVRVYRVCDCDAPGAALSAGGSTVVLGGSRTRVTAPGGTLEGLAARRLAFRWIRRQERPQLVCVGALREVVAGAFLAQRVADKNGRARPPLALVAAMSREMNREMLQAVVEPRRAVRVPAIGALRRRKLASAARVTACVVRVVH